MFLLIGILGLASIETAAARSCSEQGIECVGWVKANVPDAARQSSEMGLGADSEEKHEPVSDIDHSIDG
jgi:hypothetical protein